MRKFIILTPIVLFLLVPILSYAEYNPTTGRFLQRDPIEYEDEMNLYEYVKNSPIIYVDLFAFDAWKIDPGFKYPIDNSKESKKKRQEIIRKMQECIIKQVKKMYEAQKKNPEKAEIYDCADTALTAIIRCGEEMKTPMRFRVWDAKKKQWIFINQTDYKSRKEFEKDARKKLKALSLIDNTLPETWKDLGIGDLMLYDLRYHRHPEYTGHTMIITNKGKCDKGDCWFVYEGHTAGRGITTGKYTKEEFLKNWKGPWQGKGRYWYWRLIFGVVDK
jgi:uncharacterized protein RhaS with RHS repeats